MRRSLCPETEKVTKRMTTSVRMRNSIQKKAVKGAKSESSLMSLILGQGITSNREPMSLIIVPAAYSITAAKCTEQKDETAPDLRCDPLSRRRTRRLLRLLFLFPTNDPLLSDRRTLNSVRPEQTCDQLSMEMLAECLLFPVDLHNNLLLLLQHPSHQMQICISSLKIHFPHSLQSNQTEGTALAVITAPVLITWI